MKAPLKGCVVIALTAVACGNIPLGPGASAGKPPDLTVIAGDDKLTLAPYTYCWHTNGQGVCSDGMPPDPLPSLKLNDSSELSVTFPLEWRLEATLLPDGEYCNGALVVDVDSSGTPIGSTGSCRQLPSRRVR